MTDGKIKVYSALGSRQQEILNWLWAQENCEWTARSGKFFRSTDYTRQQLGNLMKYDVIVDIPLENEGETENGRVVQVNGIRFKWKTLDTFTSEPVEEPEEEEAEEESEDETSTETTESDPPKQLTLQYGGHTATVDVPKAKPAKVIDPQALDHDAEITALKEQLKDANERIERLRDMVTRRDGIIRDTKRLLDLVDTSKL